MEKIPKDSRYAEMKREDRKVLIAVLAIIAIFIVIGINLPHRWQKMSYQEYKSCNTRYSSC